MTTSTVFDEYVVVGEETAYNTPIAPTRAYEFTGETLAGKYERISAAGLRAGSHVERSDRFVPNPKGAAGDLKLEVLDTNFGVLFKHAMGAVATTGAASPFTHTATIGALLGKSLTVQVGRTANDGTLFPFTYSGGKVDSWELSNAVDGVLELALTLDFAAEHIGAGTGALAQAVPTYTPGNLLSFVGGTVDIGGTEFAVSDVSLKGANGLATDRYFLRTGGTTKKEPLEQALRTYSLDVKGEFESLTHINRVAALAASGTVAAVTLNWDSPTAGLGLTVTCPAVRFDEGAVNADPAKLIEQALKAVVLSDGTDTPLSIAYKTSDAAP